MSFTVEREVAEAMDWYQAHHIVEAYKKMKKLLNDDMNMDDTYEVYFEQNVGSGNFRSEIVSVRDLGRRSRTREIGSNVKLAFDIAMWTRTTPTTTDEGLFGVLEVNPIAKLVVEMPGDEHKFSHRLMRRVWYELLFHEQFEYWAEYAEAELNRYINEVRNFFGLEPTLGKSERLSYQPLVKGYS